MTDPQQCTATTVLGHDMPCTQGTSITLVCERFEIHDPVVEGHHNRSHCRTGHSWWEPRTPADLNPFEGMYMVLHDHGPEYPCTSRCTEYLPVSRS